MDKLEKAKEKTEQCPKCGEKWSNAKCICNDPIWIAIPAGQHIHIQCPVHGDIKIYSSSPTYWTCAPSPFRPMWTSTKTDDMIRWESNIS